MKGRLALSDNKQQSVPLSPCVASLFVRFKSWEYDVSYSFQIDLAIKQ